MTFNELLLELVCEISEKPREEVETNMETYLKHGPKPPPGAVKALGRELTDAEVAKLRDAAHSDPAGFLRWLMVGGEKANQEMRRN